MRCSTVPSDSPDLVLAAWERELAGKGCDVFVELLHLLVALESSDKRLERLSSLLEGGKQGSDW